MRAVSAQEELGRKEQHMEERKMGKKREERVVPSESNPDALRKKREGGAEEGYQTLINHHVDLSISKVRRLSV